MNTDCTDRTDIACTANDFNKSRRNCRNCRNSFYMITVRMALGVAQISTISAISAGLFKSQPYRLKNICDF